MRRRDEGGVPARRAVTRWSWRLFRREWRQQALVLLLITVAVAMTVAAVSAAYHMAPSGEAEFGSASHRLVVDAGDAREASVEVGAIQEWFEVTDQIRVGTVPVPGSLDDVEVRAQDPDGPLGGPLLALRTGRFPVADHEVALTDEVAETFGATVGSSVTSAARGGRSSGSSRTPRTWPRSSPSPRRPPRSRPRRSRCWSTRATRTCGRAPRAGAMPRRS